MAAAPPAPHRLRYVATTLPKVQSVNLSNA
jgi:hypothetical protein